MLVLGHVRVHQPLGLQRAAVLAGAEQEVRERVAKHRRLALSRSKACHQAGRGGHLIHDDVDGQSIDGKGEFTAQPMQPLGEKPDLGAARPQSGAQSEQIGEQ